MNFFLNSNRDRNVHKVTSLWVLKTSEQLILWSLLKTLFVFVGVKRKKISSHLLDHNKQFLLEKVFTVWWMTCFCSFLLDIIYAVLVSCTEERPVSRVGPSTVELIWHHSCIIAGLYHAVFSFYSIVTLLLSRKFGFYGGYYYFFLPWIFIEILDGLFSNFVSWLSKHSGSSIYWTFPCSWPDTYGYFSVSTFHLGYNYQSIFRVDNLFVCFSVLFLILNIFFPFQEIVSIYPVLSPPNLSHAQATRICNALVLLQVKSLPSRFYYFALYILNCGVLKKAKCIH